MKVLHFPLAILSIKRGLLGAARLLPGNFLFMIDVVIVCLMFDALLEAGNFVFSVSR